MSKKRAIRGKTKQETIRQIVQNQPKVSAGQTKENDLFSDTKNSEPLYIRAFRRLGNK